jgi:hypothetical protein
MFGKAAAHQGPKAESVLTVFVISVVVPVVLGGPGHEALLI